MKQITVKVISGGNQFIPFCGTVPPEGTFLNAHIVPPDAFGRTGSTRARIANKGEFTIGTQRGGSYGFKSGEPIKSFAFPFELFRPNQRTLEIGELEMDGCGGFGGIPLKKSCSDDYSDPKIGEKLMIYPSPYYGAFRCPVVQVVEVDD